MKIILTITDQETLDDYKDTHKDLILSDFVNNPKTWIDCGDVEVKE